MLVFAARWIWSERGNADAVLPLDRLRVPGARRTVRFRRQPPLDVPAVHCGILRIQSQFNTLSQQSAILVAILQFSADPREAIPTQFGAIIRLCDAISPATTLETLSDHSRPPI